MTFIYWLFILIIGIATVIFVSQVKRFKQKVTEWEEEE